MLIQKQPVLSWLLDPSDNECSSKVGVPIIPGFPPDQIRIDFMSVKQE